MHIGQDYQLKIKNPFTVLRYCNSALSTFLMVNVGNTEEDVNFADVIYPAVLDLEVLVRVPSLRDLFCSMMEVHNIAWVCNNDQRNRSLVNALLLIK